jgi:hypothetical protein
MTTPVTQEVTKATDLEGLQAIVRGLLGQSCWRAALSYGDELCLHIGEKVPYAHRALAGQVKGAWIFGTRGTAWRLDAPTETLASSDDDPLLARQRVTAVEGAAVIGFEVGLPDWVLTVSFANGYRLLVLPSPEDDAEDLPYWELFTPEHLRLAFGPGGVWSCTRSDQPDD